MTDYQKLVLRLLAAILRRQWDVLGALKVAKSHNDKLLLDEVDEALKEKKRPTIEELEKILNSEDTREIQINPDGSIGIGDEVLK